MRTFHNKLPLTPFHIVVVAIIFTIGIATVLALVHGNNPAPDVARSSQATGTDAGGSSRLSVNQEAPVTSVQASNGNSVSSDGTVVGTGTSGTGYAAPGTPTSIEPQPAPTPIQSPAIPCMELQGSSSCYRCNPCLYTMGPAIMCPLSAESNTRICGCGTDAAATIACRIE